MFFMFCTRERTLLFGFCLLFVTLMKYALDVVAAGACLINNVFCLLVSTNYVAALYECETRSNSIKSNCSSAE